MAFQTERSLCKNRGACQTRQDRKRQLRDCKQIGRDLFELRFFFGSTLRLKSRVSDDESRSGINSACTRWGPTAFAAKATVTLLSMPPDSATTNPLRFRRRALRENSADFGGDALDFFLGVDIEDVSAEFLFLGHGLVYLFINFFSPQRAQRSQSHFLATDTHGRTRTFFQAAFGWKTNKRIQPIKDSTSSFFVCVGLCGSVANRLCRRLTANRRTYQTGCTQSPNFRSSQLQLFTFAPCPSFQPSTLY